MYLSSINIKHHLTYKIKKSILPLWKLKANSFLCWLWTSLKYLATFDIIAVEYIRQKVIQNGPKNKNKFKQHFANIKLLILIFRLNKKLKQNIHHKDQALVLFVGLGMLLFQEQVWMTISTAPGIHESLNQRNSDNN